VNTTESAIQLDDIQAHVISSARPAAAKYFFFHIRDPSAFSAFLASELLNGLTLSEFDIQHPQAIRLAGDYQCFTNIAFSFNGLARLGLPQTLLDKFPVAFREGMAERARFIGDSGVDSPSVWEGYYGNAHLHGLIAVNYMPWLKAKCATPGKFKAPDQWSAREQELHFEKIDRCWNALLDGAATIPGAEILQREQAHVIRYGTRLKEDFGFDDGISQPQVAGAQAYYGSVGKKRSNDGEWYPLALGEFVMGYYDELATANLGRQNSPEADPTLPVPADAIERAYHALTMNGSFLVYRKLEQDVKGFRAFCANKGGNVVAEQMVGRKLNGEPLTKKATGIRDNQFDFGDDPDGKVCPFASHMRRVNPRLTLTRGVNEGTFRVDQHRIIRRGMAYGPFIEPGTRPQQAPDAVRGLHFFCYNARLDSQFEFIQKNWINNCDFMYFPSPVVDPIVGNRQQGGASSFPVDQESMPVSGLQQFVFVRGGEYFLTPGKRGLARIASLAETTNPFRMFKQRIDPFDPSESDPLEVARYVDSTELIQGKRFVKLWVDKENGARTPYYYFAHRQELKRILSLPNLFTNDLYRKRISALTGSDMLLSSPASQQRAERKERLQTLLRPALSMLDRILEPELQRARNILRKTQSIDLVEGLSRRLPLAVIKAFYGIRPVTAEQGAPVSRTQIAHYFDRSDFSMLPAAWQENYAQLGFKTTEDDTFLFWVRMLFLEVFLNQYNVPHIAHLAINAAKEFVPVIDHQIRQAIEGTKQPTVLHGLIELYQSDDNINDADLVATVRQSMLEFMVGSTDTTSKGIALVVSTLLGMGQDLAAGICAMARGSDECTRLLTSWQQGARDDKTEAAIDTLLNPVITDCLRLNPVAPLVPRYCTSGATYTTTLGDVLNIEPGAVICLLPQVSMAATLREAAVNGVPAPDNDPLIFLDGTPHACMGAHIALLEIRQALKLLLEFKNVRPAAGKAGLMQEKYKMPASMSLRCE